MNSEVLVATLIFGACETDVETSVSFLDVDKFGFVGSASLHKRNLIV